ncbi:ATPase [Rhodobacteraceae bacterium SC52]|nr:ATPase [Rhodobacteraceae bacterium SC52]
MTEWKQKRFWTSASVGEEADGYCILLDGRAIKTPSKAPLVVPAAALAGAIAAEWDAQAEAIDPNSMPLTRIANTAIDKVKVQQAEVAEILAAYGESDLLCYRAERPAELVARQAEAWDPLLVWAKETLDAPLDVAAGVMYIPQPTASVAALSRRVEALDAFDLAPFHDLVALTGSLVIGLAALQGVRPVQDLWALSRIDETWQAEQWGHDDDAAATAAIKAASFADAARFYALRHAG